MGFEPYSLIINVNFSEKEKAEAPVQEVKQAVNNEEEVKSKKRHLNVVSIGHVGELIYVVPSLSSAHFNIERCVLLLL